jgi:hypothetical protein
MEIEGISERKTTMSPFVDKEKYTSIPIMKTTRDRLRSLGQMNETYSDFIERLLDMYQKYERDALRVSVQEYMETLKQANKEMFRIADEWERHHFDPQYREGLDQAEEKLQDLEKAREKFHSLTKHRLTKQHLKKYPKKRDLTLKEQDSMV